MANQTEDVSDRYVSYTPGTVSLEDRESGLVD